MVLERGLIFMWFRVHHWYKKHFYASRELHCLILWCSLTLNLICYQEWFMRTMKGSGGVRVYQSLSKMEGKGQHVKRRAMISPYRGSKGKPWGRIRDITQKEGVMHKWSLRVSHKENVQLSFREMGWVRNGIWWLI